MVYEHLLICFILEDSSLGFSKLFQVIITIAHDDIPRLMTLMLGINSLLKMENTLRVYVLLS
jgi:hypothetical protein